MRLPRRTPWANLGELDEVCRMIYSEDSTLESKRKAVNRVGDFLRSFRPEIGSRISLMETAFTF